MFEQDGYCPSNSFNWMFQGMEDPNMAIKLRNEFGDRIGYMVYAKDEVATALNGEHCSIVEACRNICLAHDLASLLALLIPECVYAETGRKILIHDTINPKQAAREPIVETSSGRYSFFQNGRADNQHPLTRKGAKYLIQDLRWLLVIDDGNGKDDPVDIRIARLTI